MASPVVEEKPKPADPLETHVDAGTPRRKGHGWIWLILLAALAYGVWHYRGIFSSTPAETPTAGSGRGGRGGAGGPVPVAVTSATKGDVPVYLRAPGTAAAFNTVTVHSRVDGQLMNVAFKEGQFVHQGDLLAQIDPRPFQVQLEQAEGQLAHDQALMKDAQVNAQRYAALYAEGVLSKQQADTQAAQAGQYEGAIKSDQAMIDSAKLNINYCRITAPITGRIGLRLVDAGNMVHASDQNGLLVITQLQPISVLFSLPQDDLKAVNKQVIAGTQLVAEAYDRDTVTKIATGTLATIDNQIDQSTDTYKLKAVFANENNALFPNQFVYVRLLEGKKQGLTIVPPAAIQRGPQGTFVYVVNSGNTVSLRQVTVDTTEGNQTGLSAGLQPGETVVTDGMDKLQDGAKVDPHTASNSNGANAAAGSSGSTPLTPAGKSQSTSSPGSPRKSKKP